MDARELSPAPEYHEYDELVCKCTRVYNKKLGEIMRDTMLLLHQIHMNHDKRGSRIKDTKPATAY